MNKRQKKKFKCKCCFKNYCVIPINLFKRDDKGNTYIIAARYHTGSHKILAAYKYSSMPDTMSADLSCGRYLDGTIVYGEKVDAKECMKKRR